MKPLTSPMVNWWARSPTTLYHTNRGTMRMRATNGSNGSDRQTDRCIRAHRAWAHVDSKIGSLYPQNQPWQILRKPENRHLTYFRRPDDEHIQALVMMDFLWCLRENIISLWCWKHCVNCGWLKKKHEMIKYQIYQISNLPILFTYTYSGLRIVHMVYKKQTPLTRFAWLLDGLVVK